MNNTLRQYLETALWSSNDDNGIPLDNDYSIEDISIESLERQSLELSQFINDAGSLLDGLDMTDVAHDFWLTRNRHGAGFWDGDYPETVGQLLTHLSHKFKEVYVYVGDDNKVYFE